MLQSTFAAIVPIVCVTLAAIAAMIAEAFRAKDERMPIGALGLIGLGFALAGSVLLWGRNATSFGGTLQADNFGLFITITLIVVGVLTIALSGPTIERENLPAGEYYAITLFAIAGMMIMAIATDLLLIFLALEILSLAVYVLTGMRRDDPASTEGAFKYFLLGAFSSAFFLYGIALVVHAHRQHAPRSHRQLHGRGGHEREPDDADGASACCSSASRSRCRPCRSTCGRPTRTRARRRW